MRTPLLLWVTVVFLAQPTLASYDYGYGEYGYSRYSSYGSRAQAPLISIDMDPKHLRDSAFRVAAREDRLSEMLELLRKGADVNSASEEGTTALMYAARNCSTDVARELLRLEARVNLRDNEGETALALAVMESCLPVVKLLACSAHLNLHYRDRSGKTVVDYASENASLEVDGPAAQILGIFREMRQPESPRTSLRPHWCD